MHCIELNPTCKFYLQVQKQIDMKKQQLPPVVSGALNELQRKYSESPATTNAGRVLRFVSRFVTVDMLLKLIVAKKK